MFKNKIFAITGGTGSFGNAVINKLINLPLKEIRIFSRDEKKQDDMRRKYNNNKLKFIIGDVRDYQSISNALINVDYVFHAAALKQVPSCEFYPLEATKTNVLGTENVLDACIKNQVKKVICLSTDKAVYPINAMGISKALMERVAIAKSRNAKTCITITRYGNVIGSRGSVIPLFINQILQNTPITVTDYNMTRFLMPLEEAVDLVFFAFKNGSSGEVFVQKSPGATIKTLTEAVVKLCNKKKYPIQVIGTRHGEKLHEVLLSREEMTRAKDLGSYLKIAPDLRDLNYSKFFEKGDMLISKSSDYSSENTKRLNTNETVKLLLKSSHIKELVKYKN